MKLIHPSPALNADAPSHTRVRGRGGRMAVAALVTLALSFVAGVAPATAADSDYEVVTGTGFLPGSPDVIRACTDLAPTTLGQTFTAPESGRITRVALATAIPTGTWWPTTIHLRSGGATGQVLTSQPVTFTASDAIQEFTLDNPVEVTASETYGLELPGMPCSVGFQLILTSYPLGTLYGGGYAAGSPAPAEVFFEPDFDLAFRVTIEVSGGDSDSDGDGVDDAVDLCEDTVFSDGPAQLRPNRFWSPSADGFVDRTGTVGYTLADTGGCSAEQIIAEADLGRGHHQAGLSVGELKAWVAMVSSQSD